MIKSLLRVLLLAGVLAAAMPCVLRAQSVAEATEQPAADSLAVPDWFSAVEMLKAKVDSLRQALEDSPMRRRQEVNRQIASADSLLRAYDFSSSIDVLRSALSAADSSQAGAVEEALLRARAGLKMTASVPRVRVKARKRISREAFLDMFPDAAGAGKRFFAPSRDGRTLYFSTRDITGVGGYDLYVSRRDRSSGGWSQPVNMGFPYSSPEDDILYAETGDGRYSVLVSSRDCTGDSLNVYVFDVDPMPQRRAVDDARELRALAGLEPAGRQAAAAPTRSQRSGVDMSAYTARTVAVRALRDSLNTFNRELDALRERLPEVHEDEREDYLAALVAREKGVEALRKRLETATRELQDIELDFLSGGIDRSRSVPQEDVSDSHSAILHMFYSDDGAFMGLEESGTLTRILPAGSFGEYLVYPGSRSFSVKVLVPEGEELPRYALAVMRLHLQGDPQVMQEESGKAYTAGPFNERLKAESLRVALLATGVADVSVSEN